MAENQFPSTVDALFKGMDHFITSKTVVGEPVMRSLLMTRITVPTSGRTKRTPLLR